MATTSSSSVLPPPPLPPPHGAPDVPLQIAQLRPGQKGIQLSFIVMDRLPNLLFTTSTGSFSAIRVGDPSGCVNLSYATDEYDEFVKPGDIVRLRNGFTTVHKGCMSLAVGRQGELTKTGEFLMLYSETPNMSEYNSEFAAIFKKADPGADALNALVAPAEEGRSSSSSQQVLPGILPPRPRDPRARPSASVDNV